MERTCAFPAKPRTYLHKKIMTYTNLTKTKETTFTITKPRKHVFYLENLSGNYEFILDASGAEVFIYGLYTDTTISNFKLTTLQKHLAPHTQSHVFIKGVFQNASQFSYRGLIRLEKKAQKSKASLVNKNLVLSEKAFITSVPQLEILADDVKCSHASATGPLNHDQMYYLASRGVNNEDATKLLVAGFLDEVRDCVKDLE